MGRFASAAKVFTSCVKRFRRNDRGAIAVVFAISLIPILGVLGVAMDYSRANGVRVKIQGAADAAALAAGKNFNGKESDRSTTAHQVFAANAEHLSAKYQYQLTYSDVDYGSQTSVVARVDVTAKVETTLSGLLGIEDISVSVRAESGQSNSTMEIALVVDNSGSMEGSRITALKKAARDLTKALFGPVNRHPTISIGIVPFAAAVNVGPQYKTANWIDRNGVSSVHFNNFDSEDDSRLRIFDSMRNVSWGGCVEARPYPLDVSDLAPTHGNEDSYFVPLFAPDAPDNTGIYNSYISDSGGSCSGNGNGNGHAYGHAKKACKYKGENPNTSLAYGTRKGPNMMCDSSPITPLTNLKGTINSAIGKLTSYGGTNIHMGVMWGWRLLSPGVPFTEGRDYGTPYNKKIMILMSDGANFHGAFSNMFGSWYSAYGYAVEDRLGNNLTTTYDMVSAMNARTREACANARAAGINIYSIAYDISDDATVNLLRDCASSRSQAFTADSSSQLVQVFEEIANKLNDLRITR